MYVLKRYVEGNVTQHLDERARTVSTTIMSISVVVVCYFQPTPLEPPAFTKSKIHNRGKKNLKTVVVASLVGWFFDVCFHKLVKTYVRMHSPAEAEIRAPLCPGALDAGNHAVCLSFFAALSPK